MIIDIIVNIYYNIYHVFNVYVMYGQERAILNTANHREQTKNRGNSICVGVADIIILQTL